MCIEGRYRVWIATALLWIIGVAQGQAQADWTGDWQSYWRDGLSLLSLEQDGDQVRGTYSPDNGVIEGVVEDGLLRGSWREEGTEGGFEFVLAEDGQSFTGRFKNGEYWNGIRAVGGSGIAAYERRNATPEETLRAVLVLANAAVFNGDSAAVRGTERLLLYSGPGLGTGDRNLRRRLLWQILNLSTLRLIDVPDGPETPEGTRATFRVAPIGSKEGFTLEFVWGPGQGWRLMVPPALVLETVRDRMLDSLGLGIMPDLIGQGAANPRQTIRSFVRSTHDWDRGGRAQAMELLELSFVPERLRPIEGVLIADYLREVLNRVGFLIWQEIPNNGAQVEPYVFYAHPKGDITLERQVDPDTEEVAWRFSAASLEALPEIYRNMQLLPVAAGLENRPALSDFFRFRERIRATHPGLLHRDFYLENWQWIGVTLAVLGGAALASLLARLLPALLFLGLRLLDRDLDRGLMQPLRWPIWLCAFLILLLLAYVKLGLIQSGVANVGRILGVALILTGAALAYRLVGAVGAVFVRQAESTRSYVDEIVTSLALGLIKLFIIVAALIFCADVIGLPYEGVLTGLGIGGVALAFAARETVSNMLGGAILLADRPFKRGDLIAFGGHQATIETVGLRSTRLRTADDTLMVVPNSQLSDQTIANWGSRRKRRVLMEIGLTYDTPRAKLEAFTERLRETYLAQPRADTETYYVGIKDLAASAITIELWGYFKVYGYEAQVSAKHALVLDIIRLAEELQVEFAFPTQTLHLLNEPVGDGAAAPKATDLPVSG